MSASPTLAQLQSWLFERVTEPVPAAAGVPPVEELVVSGRVPARARLEVYRQGYVARLIECLVDDYPALQHALGEPEFAGLCRDFIEQHPPRSASLNGYGAPLARHCAGRSEPWAAFAAELARLEWAIVEAIHAAEGERLDVAALADLSADDWSRVRLVPSPTLRLLTTAYPVAHYYRAFREDSVPSFEWPAPEPSAVAVCRRGADVWRVSIERGWQRLLETLMAGTPLLEALEHSTAGAAPDATQATAEELQRAFRDWVACGMFSGIRLAE